MRSGRDNLYRVTPIPEQNVSTGRVSATPSVGSIMEDEEDEQDQLGPMESSNSTGRTAKLSPISSQEKLRRKSAGSAPGKGHKGFLPTFRKDSSPVPGSPTASEISEGSGIAFRSDSLYRATPIPGEAAASLSGQSSFSSLRRNGRPKSIAEPISEDEEEFHDAHFSKSAPAKQSIFSDESTSELSARLDSLGSLHRPTPIPTDILSSTPSLGSRTHRPATPTIKEDTAHAESESELDSVDHYFGSVRPIDSQLPSNASSSSQLSQSDHPKVDTSKYDAKIPPRILPSRPSPPGMSHRGLSPKSEPSLSHLAEIREGLQKDTEPDLSFDPVLDPPPGLPTVHSGVIHDAPVLPNQTSTPGHRSQPSQTSNSSAGFAPFVEQRDWERDIVGVARFLRMTPGLSRQLIGELLGENNERCLRVLEAFTASFDFTGLTFEGSLREFLESFRMPGESQKIFRILEAWSKQFYKQCGPGIFNSPDAVLVLAFSLVLLNTDKHNHTVKTKMTKEEFVRNNRGQNDGQDFPRDFLEQIFNNIERRALKFPPAPTENISRSSSLPEFFRSADQRFKTQPPAIPAIEEEAKPQKTGILSCFG